MVSILSQPGRPRNEDLEFDRFIAATKHKYPLLSQAQEKELLIQLSQLERGSKAYIILRNKIASHNTRLVLIIARRYYYNSLELCDLFSAGINGLISAIERFNIKTHGNQKLSTYAYWWIRQAISRYAKEHDDLIRVPIYLGDRLAEVRRLKAEIYANENRSVSEAEIAEMLSKTTGVTHSVKKVRNMLWKSTSQKVVSLNLTASHDSMDEIGDFIPSPDSSKLELWDSLYNLIRYSLLDDREHMVINARFGLNEFSPRTLMEVGKEMGCSRETVRLIERNAIRKMRNRAKSIGMEWEF